MHKPRAIAYDFAITESLRGGLSVNGVGVEHTVSVGCFGCPFSALATAGGVTDFTRFSMSVP
jgi:hypothetical protein